MPVGMVTVTTSMAQARYGYRHHITELYYGPGYYGYVRPYYYGPGYYGYNPYYYGYGGGGLLLRRVPWRRTDLGLAIRWPRGGHHHYHHCEVVTAPLA